MDNENAVYKNNFVFKLFMVEIVRSLVRLCTYSVTFDCTKRMWYLF